MSIEWVAIGGLALAWIVQRFRIARIERCLDLQMEMNRIIQSQNDRQVVINQNIIKAFEALGFQASEETIQ